MAIAQMNWGRLKYPLSDQRLTEFSESLGTLYSLAEHHPGFLWRIGDNAISIQLKEAGYDEKTSATVSEWQSVDDLRDYTYNVQLSAWKIFEPPPLVVREDRWPSARNLEC